jgi:alkylation response protein AidB-like acyl-CoA dehydrogenase
VWHAAWAVDNLDADDALAAARVTKAYCSAAALEVCEAAIQVWGGLGMTWEGRAHLFLRRALQARLALGNEDHHLALIGSAIIAQAAAG